MGRHGTFPVPFLPRQLTFGIAATVRDHPGLTLARTPSRQGTSRAKCNGPGHLAKRYRIRGGVTNSLSLGEGVRLRAFPRFRKNPGYCPGLLFVGKGPLPITLLEPVYDLWVMLS